MGGFGVPKIKRVPMNEGPKQLSCSPIPKTPTPTTKRFVFGEYGFGYAQGTRLLQNEQKVCTQSMHDEEEQSKTAQTKNLLNVMKYLSRWFVNRATDAMLAVVCLRAVAQISVLCP